MKHPHVWFMPPPEHRILFPDIVGVNNIYVEIKFQTPEYQSSQNLSSYRWMPMCFCKNSNVIFMSKLVQKWNIDPKTRRKL